MMGKLIWIYGMSGVGKTTLGSRLARDLKFMLVDGDVVRNFLGASKDFSPAGRREHQNQLRGWLHMRLWCEESFVVASITPYTDMRKWNRVVFREDYFEVLLDCGLDVLIARDPKSLYRMAFAGDIPYFTGVSDVFELGSPDLVVPTGTCPEDTSYKILWEGVQRWIKS
jgi:adenylylsulfate kinase-like enzyme